MTKTTREQRLRDDEPAFPIVGACADNQFNGMTLRDYFAARAMSLVEREWDTMHQDQLEAITSIAYRIADAMLKARKEPGQ